MTFQTIANLAMDELQQRSRKLIYRRDPEAWLHDVLGKAWWSKQQEIAFSVTDPSKDHTYTLVKSCNGVGKSHIGGDLATWQVATHDPMETTVLLSAPVFKQIKTVTFRYIADNYSLAAARKFILPGEMVAEPALKVQRVDGGLAKEVIQAKRPSDQNLIASFQGVHDGYVLVILDEAGGLPEDMWIAANAVTTNKNVRILAIGNPDTLNTGFHRRFLDPDKFREWNPITIAAADSPNFTGEVIYPNDPAMDERVKSLLVQVEWAEMMRRQAHPNVVRAKVDGEFPAEGDTSFFTQHSLDTAYNTDIEPADAAPVVLGVDLSFQGEDNTCLYVNKGGRVRFHKKWNKESDYMKQARMVHAEALATGCSVLQLDASGSGGSIYSLLETQDEFWPRPYLLVGLMGGRGSSDTSRWAQARSEQYDTFRQGMAMGLVDLDPDDKELRDQLYTQTYQTNLRAAIQITPKDQMRKAGLKSPDALDAAIYSYYDTGLTNGGPRPGDVVARNLEDVPDYGLREFITAAGWPM